MTKKTAKRLLAVLLSALLLLSLTACGETAAESDVPDNPAAQEQTDGQKKDDTAKTDDKQTDGKTNDSKKDAASRAEDAKKDDAKKDEAKQEETAEEKKEEPKQEEPKQEETDEEHKQVIDPATGKDKYQTDPVPPGKPTPVEPEDTTVDTSKTYTCTFSISCRTILDNMDLCEESKQGIVPSDGTILPTTTVTFSEGESVFDVLQRICSSNGIHMEYSWTPMYNSAYVEGIANLYEFDVGSLSGWMYKVNGWFPNYGCSRYQLQDGDTVCWVYTCDLGADVGCYMG